MEHPVNPKVVKKHRGQRKPHKITIETYSNKNTEYGEKTKGILPPSSREVTPVQEQPPSALPIDAEDVHFISGNPFVEVTKGIIHLYKKK